MSIVFARWDAKFSSEERAELCNDWSVVELARVLRPQGEPRGADVRWRVDVARGTLVEGAELELEVPRRLTCARCDGGGCDTCDRRGAISLRGAEQPPEKLNIVLSHAASGSVRLRIPEQGAKGAEGVPRGDLELTLCEADVGHPSVHSRVPKPVLKPQSTWWVWAVAAVALGLVYAAISTL